MNGADFDLILLTDCDWFDDLLTAVFVCHTKILTTVRVTNKNRRINLLHLGSTNSILTYSSLKYILKVLFRKLPSKILNNIQLTVVGNNPDAPYSNIIKKYAIPYKQVTFEGFKQNIEPLFKTHDLQIVATQYASGIRTKIIESLAHGLPVMSSEIGARGLYGLKNKENILLFKNERDFTEIFNGIVHRNKKTILNSIEEYGDPKSIYFGEISISL